MDVAEEKGWGMPDKYDLSHTRQSEDANAEDTAAEEGDTWDSSENTLYYEVDDLEKQNELNPSKTAEYLAIDSKTLHYFLNYLRVTFEDCFFDHAHKYHKSKLDDKFWQKKELRDDNNPNKSPFWLSELHWHQRDQVELNAWVKLFKALNSHGLSCSHDDDSKKVLDQVYQIRQAAVHRWRKIDKGALERAMQLPTMLHDGPRAAEVKRVYSAITSTSKPDRETSKLLDKLLYTPLAPPRPTIPALLQRLQHLLEQSLFPHAQRTDPTFLRFEKTKTGDRTDDPAPDGGWTIPEHVELQNYVHMNVAASRPSDHTGEKGPSVLRVALRRALDLRDKGTHRLYDPGDPFGTNEAFLREEVEWAGKLAVLVGDELQAEVIGRMADGWWVSRGVGKSR